MNCDFLRVDLLDSSGETMGLTSKFTKTKSAWSADGVTFIKDRTDKLYLNAKKAIKAAEKKASASFNSIGDTDDDSDACRITGTVEIHKIAGMLHVTALGHGLIHLIRGYWGEHTPHELINFTHRIDTLSFGRHYPGLINPLDKSLEFSTVHFVAFRYFLNIVPTIYVDHNRLSLLSLLGEKILLTNQYAGLLPLTK